MSALDRVREKFGNLQSGTSKTSKSPSDGFAGSSPKESERFSRVPADMEYRGRAVDDGFEARRQRVLAMLAHSPATVRYAWLVDPNTGGDYVSVALAIRDVGSCELRVLKERYDAARMMEIIEASARTPDEARQ